MSRQAYRLERQLPAIREGAEQWLGNVDNATANDLAAQLPLTLSFRDHKAAVRRAPCRRT